MEWESHLSDVSSVVPSGASLLSAFDAADVTLVLWLFALKVLLSSWLELRPRPCPAHLALRGLALAVVLSDWCFRFYLCLYMYNTRSPLQSRGVCTCTTLACPLQPRGGADLHLLLFCCCPAVLFTYRATGVKCFYRVLPT